MCMTSATYSRCCRGRAHAGGSYGRGCRGVAVSECGQYDPNSPPTRNRGPPYGHQGNTEYAQNIRSPSTQKKSKHTNTSRRTFYQLLFCLRFPPFLPLLRAVAKLKVGKARSWHTCWEQRTFDRRCHHHHHHHGQRRHLSQGPYRPGQALGLGTQHCRRHRG